jgi:hypothetical protein
MRIYDVTSPPSANPPASASWRQRSHHKDLLDSLARERQLISQTAEAVTHFSARPADLHIRAAHRNLNNAKQKNHW